ncbi:MAG: hypothetical protein Q8M26_08745 [Pseudolabrys sp.]|nr:hypothetical protein [Pseudolabrys sp.]
MLTVTTAAPDPTLLTLAEVAEAIGVSSFNNLALQRLNERVSELLAGACGMDRAGAAILTLREETYSETVRLRCPVDVLYLSRKPIIEVLSVEEDGAALVVADDYEQCGDRSLCRVQNGCPAWWASGKTIVSFRAGFTTVPPGLKELAAKLANTLHAERGRDPSLGSMDIPGVISETYRYGRPDDPLVPAEIMEGLVRGGFVYSHTMIG